MEAVVAPDGTAQDIVSAYYGIAGKTGTAEASSGLPHAWFAGYAPCEDQRIALAVIVEHGESGSATAAPIARYIFDPALLPESQRSPWPSLTLDDSVSEQPEDHI